MAKDGAERGAREAREVGDVVSIVGPGMKIVGDCSSDGTIRVEGRIEGSVKAGKSVVVGVDGVVVGDVITQDAIIAGNVNGSITAQSRVELQSSCRVQGDIRSRRVKLDEGGHVDGKLHMGEGAASAAAGSAKGAAATRDGGPAARTPNGGTSGQGAASPARPSEAREADGGSGNGADKAGSSGAERPASTLKGGSSR